MTGPLAEAFGWQLALAFNAVFPLLAATVWVPLTRRAPARGRATARAGRTGQGRGHPAPGRCR